VPHIDLPPTEFQRVANVVPPPPESLATSVANHMQPDPNSVSFKTWTNPSAPPESSWTKGWRRADIGAANGHGNARSVATASGVGCRCYFKPAKCNEGDETGSFCWTPGEVRFTLSI
jgi:hypothetical protein